MLIEFSVENFLSFKDKVTLSMVAGKRKDDDLPQNVIKNAYGSNIDLLRSAVIYGPNASGKSNLIQAIQFMRNLIFKEPSPEKGKTIAPGKHFLLDSACASRPIKFAVTFFLDGIRYQYGFSILKTIISEEYLKSYPAGKTRSLFTRWTTRNGKSTFKFSRHFGTPAASLKNKTREDTLFLSVASKFNNEIAERVVGWFSDRLRQVVDDPHFFFEELAYSIKIARDNQEAEKNLYKLLVTADPTITKFKIEKKKQTVKQLNIFSDELRNETRKKSSDKFNYQLLVSHKGFDDRGRDINVSLDLFNESDGTQKIAALSGPLYHVLNNCCTLVADELDLHLHTLLTRGIVKLFYNRKLSPDGGQLIFTTHNTQLLDRTLFRKDQIWFLERGEDGSSELYSLWDFKNVRKEDNIRNRYLAGSYGAIPIINFDLGK